MGKKRLLAIACILAIAMTLFGCSSDTVGFDNGHLKFKYNDTQWRVSGESTTDWYDIVTLKGIDNDNEIKIIYGDNDHVHAGDSEAYMGDHIATATDCGQISDFESSTKWSFPQSIQVYEYQTTEKGKQRFLFYDSDGKQIRIEETIFDDESDFSTIEDSVSFYKTDDK